MSRRRLYFWKLMAGWAFAMSLIGSVAANPQQSEPSELSSETTSEASAMAGAEQDAPIAATDDQGTADTESVEQLLRQLLEGSTQESQKAEDALIRFGADALNRLPQIDANTPERARIQLRRIRKAITTTTATTKPAKLYSIVGSLSVAEAITSIKRQAGLRTDLTDEYDSELPTTKQSFSIKEKPFWEAIEVITKKSDLALSPYSGDARMFALVPEARSEGINDGHVCTAGPFRFEASRLESVRDLRNPEDRILRLVVMMFWDPDSTPVTVRHDVNTVNVVAGDDTLEILQNQAATELPVRESIAAIDIEFPFDLPSRNVQTIDKLTGTVTAVVPGEKHKFEFDSLGGNEAVEKVAAGVKVVIERARTVQNLQDVRLLIKLDNAGEEMQTNMSWIYNNIAYLSNKAGDRFDDVLAEIYQQEPGEIGVLYKYDAPGGIGDYTFHYETPAGFQTVSVNYVLENIELP